MMDFPWRRLAATAAVGATLATLWTSIPAGTWSLAAFPKYYLYACVLSLAPLGLWQVLLYPRLFSPLIGLPEPSGGSWWNGQWAKIHALPNGVPMQEW